MSDKGSERTISSARADEDAELPARHEAARFVLLPIVFKLILIAHSSLLN